MEKNVIDRRLEILEAEGITFECNMAIGKEIEAAQLEKDYDAVILATGATIKREMPIPGATLIGIVQAMDFLPHNNKAVDGQHDREEKYLAKGKNVIVIGCGGSARAVVMGLNSLNVKQITVFSRNETSLDAFIKVFNDPVTAEAMSNDKITGGVEMLVMDETYTP